MVHQRLLYGRMKRAGICTRDIRLGRRSGKLLTRLTVCLAACLPFFGFPSSVHGARSDRAREVVTAPTGDSGTLIAADNHAPVLSGFAVKVHATDNPGETIFGNLTEVDPLYPDAGYITVFPCLEGLPQPLTSNINWTGRSTTANSVTVRADLNGDICLRPSNATHMIWDQVMETAAVTAHNAVRKLDTRSGFFPHGTQLIWGSGRYLDTAHIALKCAVTPDPYGSYQVVTVTLSGLLPDQTPNNKSDDNGDQVSTLYAAEEAYMPGIPHPHTYYDADGPYTMPVDWMGNDVWEVFSPAYLTLGRARFYLQLDVDHIVGSASYLAGQSLIFVDVPCG